MKKTKSRQSGVASDNIKSGLSKKGVTNQNTSRLKPKPSKQTDLQPPKPADHKEPFRSLRHVVDEYRRKYADLFDLVPEALFTLDPEGTIIEANVAAADMLGLDINALKGERLDRWIAPEDRRRFNSNCLCLPAGKCCRSKELCMKRSDGCEFRVKAACVPRLDEHGRIRQVSLILTDLSQTIQTERTLRNSERRFRSLFESCRDFIHILNVNARILETNQQALAELGYARDEFVGQRLDDFFTPDSQKRFRENFPVLLEGGPYRQEVELICKDGRKLPVDCSAGTVCDKLGRVEFCVFFQRDISDRRKTEEKMLGLAKFPSENPNPVFRIAKDGILLYANDACTSLLAGWNYRQNNTVSETWCRIALRALACKKVQTVELKHGDRLFSFVVSPITDEGYVNVYGRDITEHNEAERKLRDQGQFLRNAIDSLNHPFYVINVDDFTIAMANKAAIGAMELGDGTTCYALTHRQQNPCDCLQHPCPIKVIKDTHKPVVVEHTHYNKDGVPRIFEVHGYPICDEEGQIRQVIEYNFDITERKEAELERERLMQTLEAKNKELQSIVYVASHDLKTPLINIRGFGEELTEHCRKLTTLLTESVVDDVKHEIEQLLDESIPEAIDFINAGTHRINNLINGLLQVSRVGSEKMHIQPLDMNRLIAEIVESIHYQAKDRGVTVKVDDLPGCVGDPMGTSRIFANLVNNALKYMAPGRKGRINISGRTEKGRSIYCVEDNGIGIAPQHQSKVFEVFHRLDPNDSAGGEGLGLTIVVRILDRQEGQIRLESEPGKGSRFYISLPAA